MGGAPTAFRECCNVKVVSDAIERRGAARVDFSPRREKVDHTIESRKNARAPRIVHNDPRSLAC